MRVTGISTEYVLKQGVDGKAFSQFTLHIVTNFVAWRNFIWVAIRNSYDVACLNREHLTNLVVRSCRAAVAAWLDNALAITPRKLSALANVPAAAQKLGFGFKTNDSRKNCSLYFCIEIDEW